MSASILGRTTVVIPFRLGSQRFPGKVLAEFRGATLLEHAMRNAAALQPLEIVLTAPAEDLHQVAGCVDLDRMRVTPSDPSALCATDRIVEIRRHLAGDYVLSLPVDEPAIDVSEIVRVLSPGPDVFVSAAALTFHCPFVSDADACSPLSAKVVLDRDGQLLYMSRAIVPVRKDGSFMRADLKKNVGAFVFDHTFLDVLANNVAVQTHLDALEGLEQLRWLELGLSVRSLEIHHVGFGIDVPEQLALLEERLAWT